MSAPPAFHSTREIVDAFAKLPLLSPPEVQQLRQELRAANPRLAEQLGLTVSNADLQNLLEEDIERVATAGGETFSVLVRVEGRSEEAIEVSNGDDVERALRENLEIAVVDDVSVLFGGAAINGTFEETPVHIHSDDSPTL